MTAKIAERRQANDPAINESTTKFRGIFARTYVNVALLDRFGHVVESNSALQRMLGYNADELRVKPLHELACPDDADLVMASFSKILAALLHEIQIEVRFTAKNRREVWTRLTMSLLRANHGDPVCAVAILEDITETKHIEEALRFSEFKFRALFESNVAPLMFWHADGHALDANDAYLALTGSTRAELLAGQLRWDERTTPADRPLDVRAREELSAGKRPSVAYEVVMYEERLLRYGRQIPVLTSLSLLPGHDDRGFGCFIDLTRQKNALKQSEESRALIKAVFSSLSGYVAVIDAEGNVLAVNDAWGTPMTNEEQRPLAVGNGANYIDMCRRTVAAGDRRAETALAGIDSVLNGKSTKFAMEYASGKYWFEMTVQPLRREEGGAIVSHIDITDRHLAEVETRNMRTELSHFARVAMMGVLTASLAHELSQPLSAIMANAQAAQRLLGAAPPDIAELREIFGDILANQLRASETIRRVRGLMKKSAPEYQLLDLNAVIAEIVGLVNTEIAAKSVSVFVHLAHGLPKVRGDRVQLQQVMLNLILNALDAMKHIAIDQRRLDIVSVRVDNVVVQVSIQDTGKGIDLAMMDRMFDPFYTDKPDGLGMGLAICRSIVESHGGSIHAANNADRGATFQFTLPISVESSS